MGVVFSAETFKDIFSCHTSGDATGFQWAGHKNATKHLTIHKRVPSVHPKYFLFWMEAQNITVLRMETQGYPYLGLWHCCTSCWWGHPRFWRVTQNLPHCIHGSHRDPIRSSSTQAHPHFWYLKMKWIYTN